LPNFGRKNAYCANIKPCVSHQKYFCRRYNLHSGLDLRLVDFDTVRHWPKRRLVQMKSLEYTQLFTSQQVTCSSSPFLKNIYWEFLRQKAYSKSKAFVMVHPAEAYLGVEKV
jgi:hypothetical protein